MKEYKKELLDKIGKLSKKGSKFESKVLNLALQKLDAGDYVFDGPAVYTADRKRLVYILGNEATVDIPEGVETIGEMAVAHKKNLSALSLPSTLKLIERDAFCDCDALTQVVIPASVERIEAYAFADCDVLKSVYFEAVPKELNRKAFADCERLHDISVPAGGVKPIRKALHMVDGDTDFIVAGRGEAEPKETTKKAKADTAAKPQGQTAKPQAQDKAKGEKPAAKPAKPAAKDAAAKPAKDNKKKA